MSMVQLIITQRNYFGSIYMKQPEKQPFFYDITLRDGNQSLKKPWSLPEKEIIFKRLLELNVQAVEVGFANSSEMDFEACKY